MKSSWLHAHLSVNRFFYSLGWVVLWCQQISKHGLWRCDHLILVARYADFGQFLGHPAGHRSLGQDEVNLLEVLVGGARFDVPHLVTAAWDMIEDNLGKHIIKQMNSYFDIMCAYMHMLYVITWIHSVSLELYYVQPVYSQHVDFPLHSRKSSSIAFGLPGYLVLRQHSFGLMVLFAQKGHKSNNNPSVSLAVDRACSLHEYVAPYKERWRLSYYRVPLSVVQRIEPKVRGALCLRYEYITREDGNPFETGWVNDSRKSVRDVLFFLCEAAVFSQVNMCNLDEIKQIY